MARRTLVSALWFAWIYLTGEVIWSIAATPRWLHAGLALGVALFVFADPLRQFHPHTQRANANADGAALPHEAQLLPR
jgi:hypothetical protein